MPRIGGAGRGALFEDNVDYYKGSRNDYFRSLARLKKEKVDLFLGNHCWNNNTDEKAAAMEANPGINPFVDGKEFYRFLDFCYTDVKERMKREGLTE